MKIPFLLGIAGAEAILAENKTCSEMAFEAASNLLTQTKVSAADVGLIVFSSTLLKDRACWSASSDLALKLGAHRAAFIDLFQGCNGVMASIEYAILKMNGDPDLNYALIVSAERFPDAITSKKNCDYDCFYGDGAGALLLQRNCKQFQITSFNSKYIPDLNEFIFMNYGSYADVDSGFKHEGYYPKVTKKKFLEAIGKERIHQYFDEGTIFVFENCLKESKINSFQFAIIPNYSLELSELISGQLKLPLTKTSYELAKTFGHIGCVDPILNFSLSLKSRQLKSSKDIFILSHGAGASVMGMSVKNLEIS